MVTHRGPTSPQRHGPQAQLTANHRCTPVHEEPLKGRQIHCRGVGHPDVRAAGLELLRLWVDSPGLLAGHHCVREDLGVKACRQRDAVQHGGTAAEFV
jgi:hypothetical protein